ncbi:PIN domain-containing protein [soil metagenome]
MPLMSCWPNDGQTQALTEAVVLDASAILAWRDRHPRAHELVEPVLAGALLCAVNGAEVRYKAADSGDDPDALIRDLLALGVVIVPFADDHARHVPTLRDIDRASRFAQKSTSGGRRKSLSLADLSCLALAMEENARVITGDGHWSTLTEHGLTVSVSDYRR